jgi:glycosyltransferase involved in cell wall biosynthesis
MQVLALTEGPNHVCYRYRIAPFADALDERGWQLSALPLASRTLERGSQLRAAASADVVILQRKLLPLWQLRALRKWSRVLIYDFDDALFHRDSYSRKGASSWARLAHFWATIYTADAVLAGNEYLRTQATSYIEPDRVHWMPTSVDPQRYPLACHHAEGARARLVWIGQHSTLPCLTFAQPLLAAAAARLPGLSLKVICNRFPTLDQIPVLPRVWSSETEANEIASADIGVSWLPDDPWSQGKCGLKVLQYMAAGLPVVANPVGMNRQMIVHGENGYLAESAEDWAGAIARLAADPALRQRMGAAGRAMVEEHYSVRRWARWFAAFIDRVAGQPPHSESHAVPRPHFALPREVSS